MGFLRIVLLSVVLAIALRHRARPGDRARVRRVLHDRPPARHRLDGPRRSGPHLGCPRHLVDGPRARPDPRSRVPRRPAPQDRLAGGAEAGSRPPGHDGGPRRGRGSPGRVVRGKGRGPAPGPPRRASAPRPARRVPRLSLGAPDFLCGRRARRHRSRRGPLAPTRARGARRGEGGARAVLRAGAGRVPGVQGDDPHRAGRQRPLRAACLDRPQARDELLRRLARLHGAEEDPEPLPFADPVLARMGPCARGAGPGVRPREGRANGQRRTAG